MQGEKSLEGIRGWLYVVAFAIFVSPSMILVQVLPFYSAIFSDGTWQALTTPGVETYHKLWAPVIVGEMVVNALLFFMWLYVAFLFLSKNKSFPKWYITILLSTLIFIIVDAFVVNGVVQNLPLFDQETVGPVMRSLIACSIWVPYMLVSKRVKNTFVN